MTLMCGCFCSIMSPVEISSNMSPVEISGGISRRDTGEVKPITHPWSLFGALPEVHTFTGCNFTAHFFSKGKQRHLDRMKEIPGCMETFAALGMQPNVPDPVLSTMESFVCAMYTRQKWKVWISKGRYFMNVHMPPKANFKSFATNIGH